jgi:uncharacterized protein YbjT (DUF2867 family)
VKLSTIGAEPGAPVAFWDWHGRVEQHVRASGMPAVVLQSSFSMANVLAAAGQVAQTGRLFAPAGDARIAMIDPRDVGEAAAALLTAPWDTTRTEVVTGQEAIGYAHVAAAIAAATGNEVEFVDVPDAGARQGLIEPGLPQFVADQIVAIFQQLRTGVAAEVTDGVERLTGRPPRTFAAFVRDRAQAFTLAALAAGE